MNNLFKNELQFIKQFSIYLVSMWTKSQVCEGGRYCILMRASELVDMPNIDQWIKMDLLFRVPDFWLQHFFIKAFCMAKLIKYIFVGDNISFLTSFKH